MTTLLFARRFLTDYARNGANVLFLVVVPVVLVVVAARSMADAARLLGGAGDGPAVETTTAGWAAGFLAGIAMYFQVSAARDADRRLVIAGLPATRLVAARLLAGLALALLATLAALTALMLRVGVDDPVRIVAGTLMFAVIYLAIGAVVGAAVRTPVNGTVVILFVWILDVFFGPTLSAATRAGTRLLPTHFVSLWMVDLPSRHGGRLGDLGLALAWTAGALLVAFAVVAKTSGVVKPRPPHVAARRVGSRAKRRGTPGSLRDQLAAALRMGWLDWSRNPVLWILLVLVPAVFILLSDLVTPPGSTFVVLNEGGVRAPQMLDPKHMHAATMAATAVASLATLAGLFLVLDARLADRRLVLAGLRPGALLTARLGIVALAALLAAGVSLAVVALVFDAHQWLVYAGATVLIAVTYGLLGVLLGPLFGRVSGVFIAFLLPFLDLGIGQSPMLGAEPAAWAQYLPGFGAMRVLIDGALTANFDEFPALLLAMAWLAALALAAAAVFHRAAVTARRDPRISREIRHAAPRPAATTNHVADPVSGTGI